MSRKHHNNKAAIPLAPASFSRNNKRPMIAQYVPKANSVKNDVSGAILAKYDMDPREFPIEQQAGSTLPLMEMASRDFDSDEPYDPFEHRKLIHPTSDLDTLIHLLKGSLGSGILAMPMAFRNAGLYFGLVATFTIGIICTYCVHILVKTAHELCHKVKKPSLGFAETAEAAFLSGPPAVHKFSRLAKAMVNSFLVIDLLGCCCVYIVFVAKNVKQVVDHHAKTTSWLPEDLNIRIYMVMVLPLLLLINLIRNLKYLAPFSMIANILVGTGMGITFYYLFQDMPNLSERIAMASVSRLPTFFGTAIFALEGIGVVMPLENNMKTPRHFIGCPGVLNTGMLFVVSLYATTGFFGYLKYGTKTEGSITLNLPQDEVLGQCVKLMIAVAIFFTYALQFYVPMEIIWSNVKHRFGGSKRNMAEYIIRILLVITTLCIAVAIPNLGPFISLVGAVCLSFLGMIFPAVIETVTFWDSPNGLGRFNWVLCKNVFLVCFGVLGCLTGAYVSILDIISGAE